ncbi:MAG: hypothetical protein RLZZ543_2145 [Bacteroidota bacterium]|jgi:hypothetical protein
MKSRFQVSIHRSFHTNYVAEGGSIFSFSEAHLNRFGSVMSITPRKQPLNEKRVTCLEFILNKKQFHN